MFGLNISRLILAIENSSGHEHRMQPIALRAATILGERLSERYSAADRALLALHVEAVTAPALNLELDRTSDEQAARQIAGAWLEALALHLKA
jgi:hypothetical protein